MRFIASSGVGLIACLHYPAGFVRASDGEYRPGHFTYSTTATHEKSRAAGPGFFMPAVAGSDYFFLSTGATGADWPATNGYLAKIAATAFVIEPSLSCIILEVTTPSSPPWNTAWRFSRSMTSMTSVPTL